MRRGKDGEEEAFPVGLMIIPPDNNAHDEFSFLFCVPNTCRLAWSGLSLAQSLLITTGSAAFLQDLLFWKSGFDRMAHACVMSNTTFFSFWLQWPKVHRSNANPGAVESWAGLQLGPQRRRGLRAGYQFWHLCQTQTSELSPVQGKMLTTVWDVWQNNPCSVLWETGLFVFVTCDFVSSQCCLCIPFYPSL